MLSDQSSTRSTLYGPESWTFSQTTPDSNTVKTSISLVVNKSAILTELLDFESLIRLNPLVQSLKILNDGDANGPCSYEVVDRLKFWGVTFSQSYTAKFNPMNDGLLVLTKAGKMVTTSASWSIEEDGLNKFKLSETIQVECPSILRSYVISQIKASRVHLFQGICEKIYYNTGDQASIL